MLKERLCFDPEFWNLLNLRTHCLELMSDKVMKAAVLSDMKEDEEKEQSRGVAAQPCSNTSCVSSFHPCQCPPAATGAKEDPVAAPNAAADAEESPPLVNDPPRKRRRWKRRLGRRKKSRSDDPEITFNLGSPAAGNKPTYSLRDNQSNKENTSAAAKLPLNREREYLSRRVKSQIFKRKGRKRRWLQGLLTLEQDAGCTERVVMLKLPGKKRGRKPFARLEYSYPDNELALTKDEEKTQQGDMTPDSFDQREAEGELVEPAGSAADRQRPVDGPAGEPPPAAKPEPDGALVVPPSSLLEHFHSYCMRENQPDGEREEQAAQVAHPNELNGDGEEVDSVSLEVSTWQSTVFLIFLSRLHVQYNFFSPGSVELNYSAQ